MQRTCIATVLAVAGTVLHEDVVRAAAHQAEPLVTLDAGLAHKRTAAEVSPLAVNLLPNLATHRGLCLRQMLLPLYLLAVRDRERTVVERVRTLWVGIGATLPAFDGQSCAG